ncbi:MAG: response regulator transcription factor [Oscillospiraceae bacterium]|nr:response regulator transcription factor [Oscillospiraceae bacterium]MBR6608903.1 response regulator transcription factor [Oscillospiraceae bacterium]
MARILLVEDEDNIGEVIELNLTLAGHSVVRVSSAEAAQDIWEGGDTAFDIALLDIMLPGMSGIDLCDYIRERSDDIGIIMLSAKSQEQDKVIALSTGADDYITKPFGVNELQARISALMRRIRKEDKKTAAQGEDVLVSGPFTLNITSRVLMKNDTVIDLTSVEFSIMELFFRNEGVALTREKILEGVWGENYYGDIKIVDVNIRRLRMKIEEDPSGPEFIVTVWGFGYRWTV